MGGNGGLAPYATFAEKGGARGAAAFFAERGKNGDPERAVKLLEGWPE